MTKPKIPKKIPKERPERINPGIPLIPEKKPDYVPAPREITKPEKPEEVPAYMPDYMTYREYRQRIY